MNQNKYKVLFIILTNLRDHGNAGNYQDYPYGVLSIIGHNENLGDFEILDLIINQGNEEEWLDTVRSAVHDNSPDIVGISVMFDNAYHGISPISDLVKSIDQNIVVVAGGPAISPAANEVMKFQRNLDAVCFSEGELPFEAILLSDDIHQCLEDHPSWITKAKSANGIKPRKSLLKNLDGVADINFGLVDTAKYKARASFNPLIDDIDRPTDINLFPVVTSRGCPFKCSFCWHSGENDTSMRYASVDAVVSHVRNLVENYGATAISIYDDMLLLPAKRAKELFSKLAEFNIRIELPNGLSPTYIDEELASLMHAAGVRSVRLAIESGDEFVLHKIINKPLRVRMVKPVVEILKKFNFWIVGFFVVGMPGENDQQRQATLDLMIDASIDLSSVSVASPSKGSLLYEQCIENGFIPNPQESFLESGYIPGEGVISTPEFSAEYIADQAYIMNLAANFVHNNRIMDGQIELGQKYLLYIVNSYPFHAFAHYYLAILFSNQGNFSKSREHSDAVAEICENDPKWLGYFRHFNIDPFTIAADQLLPV